MASVDERAAEVKLGVDPTWNNMARNYGRTSPNKQLAATRCVSKLLGGSAILLFVTWEAGSRQTQTDSLTVRGLLRLTEMSEFLSETPVFPAARWCQAHCVI